MAGHTRRFNPSHQWIHRRLRDGSLTLYQLEVQTISCAAPTPMLWASRAAGPTICSGITPPDLFHHQTGETATLARAIQGPPHPTLGVAMDVAIQLKVPSGSICNLSRSFNNDGPLGSVFRYIWDHGTFIARYDDLVDGWERPVDVSGVAFSDERRRAAGS